MNKQKEKGYDQKISPRDQTMIADTGKDRIITGMIKVRITGMRQKIPEKAEVHDIKEEQGYISGSEELVTETVYCGSEEESNPHIVMFHL